MNGVTLLQRGAERAVEAVFKVVVAAPVHDVGEQIAIEGGVLFQQRLEIEHAFGGHELVEPHLVRGDGGPLFLHVPVVGVRAAVTHTLEDHNPDPTSVVQPWPVPNGGALCQHSAMSNDATETIKQGYTFAEPAIELGVLMVDGKPQPDTGIRIPLSMLNRHGLIAGATGTGKTKTLQLLAEQISNAGIPVFAADIKGDLSGLAEPGQSSEKLLARTQAVGQDWHPQASFCDFYAIGGQGAGVPVRTTVSSFGPRLLSKVLGLTDVQESCLSLVFHYADTNQLPLLDLTDLVALLQYLNSDDGKAELMNIGGLSSATAGVLLRELVAFSAQGADSFFGEPEFNTHDLLYTNPEGKGLISLLELPNLQDRPMVFATFLMWLLADLFHDLPEVGDVDKPKLVFFFDEAHLLFDEASKAFLADIEQTVRLIRSKGVGVFFITQQPTDIPDSVLAQLGSRVQHQLRAHTPNDAKALKQTVNTYPTSAYDLTQVLQSLGIGEAIVTVMNPNGAPTPVAWTRMRAPQSLMAAIPPDQLAQRVQRSPQMPKYATPVDRDSAREILARRLEEGAQMAEQEAQEKAAAEAEAKARTAQEKEAARAQTRAEKEAAAAAAREARAQAQREAREERERAAQAARMKNAAVRAGTSILSQVGRDVVRSIFGTARRR